MIFDGLLSNGQNKALLTRLCESGRLPHALLLLGERGSGRFRLARMIAAAGVCRVSPSGCGTCPDCRMAMENQHPDVEVYAKEGAPRTLAISSLREITRAVATPPVQGRRRVVILRDLQNAAQMRTLNALLKVIEEPPEYLMFVLTADNRDHLLPTIVSRCVQLRMELPGVEECARQAIGAAREQGAQPQEEQALRCAALSRGNIGRCVALLTDTPEAQTMKDALDVCRAALQSDRYATLITLRRYERDRAGYRELLRCLQDAFGSLLEESLLPGGGNGRGGNGVCLPDGVSFNARQGMRVLDALDEAVREGRQNVNLPLTLTRLCARLNQAVTG